MGADTAATGLNGPHLPATQPRLRSESPRRIHVPFLLSHPVPSPHARALPVRRSRMWTGMRSKGWATSRGCSCSGTLTRATTCEPATCPRAMSATAPRRAAPAGGTAVATARPAGSPSRSHRRESAKVRGCWEGDASPLGGAHVVLWLSHCPRCLAHARTHARSTAILMCLFRRAAARRSWWQTRRAVDSPARTEKLVIRLCKLSIFPHGLVADSLSRARLGRAGTTPGQLAGV